MAATCDPKLLPAQATCFRCADPGTRKEIQLYLLGQLLGGASAPSLSAGAATYRPLQNKLAMAAEVYLLAVLNGQSSVPSALEKLAACWWCIPKSERLDVSTYLLAVAAGGSTDPKVLEKSAAPYRPLIPMYDQVKLYVFNTLAGTLSLKTIMAGASCFMCLDSARLEEIYLYLLCSFKGSSPAPPALPAVTGFTFVPTPDGLNEVATWAAPPAGITKTEVWISTDGGAFALAGSVAAPGTTRTLPAQFPTDYDSVKVRYCNATTCGPFTQVQNVYGAVSDWCTRVQGNGGAQVSQATATAVNTFYDAMHAVGTIIGKVKSLCVFPPDNLIAAVTPLIKTFGNDPWTFNGGIGSFELTVNGIRATAVNSLLITGCIPSTCFASTSTGGLSCYVSVTHNADGGADTDMGSQNAAGQSCLLYTNFNSAFSAGQIYNNTTGSVTSLTIGTGFWCTNVQGAAAASLYYGSSGTGFITAGTIATGGGTRPTFGIYLMGQNNSGVTTGTTTIRRYSFGCIHDGFTTAEAQALYNAVQALRTAFGGGFV